MSADILHCGSCTAAPCLGPGAACCSGSCVNTLTDPNHCGGCNTQCNDTAKTCCNGVCTNLSTDLGHCGSCTALQCQGQQPTCCNGVCTDLATSPQNCGACNAPCTGSSACCGGKCVQLSTDLNNCGSCGETVCDIPFLLLTVAVAEGMLICLSSVNLDRVVVLALQVNVSNASRLNLSAFRQAHV